MKKDTRDLLWGIALLLGLLLLTLLSTNYTANSMPSAPSIRRAEVKPLLTLIGDLRAASRWMIVSVQVWRFGQ
jgi:hypothetical protein